MNRLSKERLKSFILLILIITSLIQVGILWDYQNHGLPNFLLFFSRISASSNISFSDIKEDYFKPDKIIISNGFNEPHWMIKRNNQNFEKLWDDLKKYYLEDIVKKKPDSTYIKEKSEAFKGWDEIAVQKAIIYEFKSNMSIKLFAGFVGLEETASGGPDGIYKIAVLPWEDINFNTNVLYILDGNKVHKYTLDINSKAISKEGYEGLIDKLSKDNGLRNYSAVKEFFPPHASRLQMRQDMLLAVTGSKYNSYPLITGGVPDEINVFNSKSTPSLEELSEKILREEKDSYDPAEDKSGAIIFKNSDNSFKINSDGLMEYRYLPKTDESEKGDIKDAFVKSVEFINKYKQLTSGVEYRLTDFKEDNSSYRFVFDYEIDNIPLYFNYELKNNERGFQNNALIIESSSKRVLNCRWVLKKFERKKEYELFNVIFENLLENTFKKYESLKNDKQFSIDDISVSYKIEAGAPGQIIEPQWIITSGENRYFVPMSKENGE